MIKNIFQLYALFVCFITVMILIITFSLSLNLLTQCIFSEYKYYDFLKKYESNENYLQSFEEKTPPQPQKILDLKKLSPAQLEDMRLSQRKEYLSSRKAQSISDLILYAIWILVASIFFFIHWGLYKKTTTSAS